MTLEHLRKTQQTISKLPKKISRIIYIKDRLFDEFVDINKSELFFIIGFSEKWYYQNKEVLKNPKIRELVDYIIQFIECRLENELWQDASYGSKTQLAKLIYNKSENKQVEFKTTTEPSEIDKLILEKFKEASEKS